MKKCPSCDKTFEDTFRFCQQDGTPLVDADPPLDPYATMVSGMPIGTPIIPSNPEPAESLKPLATDPPSSISEPAEDLPKAEKDPLRTMYVSEAEMREAMASHGGPSAANDDTPAAPAEPERPAASEPEIYSPSSDWTTPPPSPFANADPTPGFSAPEPTPSPSSPSSTDFHQTSPPKQSPFNAPKTSPFDPVSAAPPLVPQPISPEPASPPFDQRPYDEPPTVMQPSFSPASEPPAASWNPPEPPVASWQNQEIGSNTPLAPPPAGAGAPSQGLAIGALVCGGLSCICCVTPLTAPAGIVMGFIARKKANEDPSNYGGAGLALGGIITGVLGILGFILGTILYFLGFLAAITR